MYVCICHGVTDKQIRAAAESGIDSLEGLSRHLSVATCCGRCAECAEQLLQESAAPETRTAAA